MKHLTFIIFILIFTSCVTRPENAIDGFVNDFNTNQPISNVHIYEKGNPDNYTYTDSTGKFKVPAKTVIVEKENYEKKTVIFDHCESEYILLKPIGK